MKNIQTKYEGFSLIEMIITVGIIGMVMLISSATLTTLIKTSTVSSSKTMVRNETEFILELVRRNIRNSNPSDVYVFRSYDAEESFVARQFNPETNEIVNNELIDMEDLYASNLGPNTDGNEIHFRPYGYDRWVCIGYFPSTADSEFAYILKTSAQDLWDNHESCFENTDDYARYTIVLNSDAVDINDFDISYVESADSNYLFKFDIVAQPVHWYFGSGAPVNREVFRQAVVTTGGLIW